MKNNYHLLKKNKNSAEVPEQIMGKSSSWQNLQCRFSIHASSPTHNRGFLWEETQRWHSFSSNLSRGDSDGHKHITQLCRDDGKCPSRSLQGTQGPSRPLQQITQVKMLVISQHLVLTARAVKCVTFFALTRQQGATVSSLQWEQQRYPKQKSSRLCWQQWPSTCFTFIYQDCLKNRLSDLMCLSDHVFGCSNMLPPDFMHVKLITYQLLSTAVIQMKSLPRGHGSLLVCELWPHSKVMQLNYLLLV